MIMCGGVYEDELKEELATEQDLSKYKRKPMGDIKFMTAADFMEEQDDGYCYPGSDPQE